MLSNKLRSFLPGLLFLAALADAGTAVQVRECGLAAARDAIGDHPAP